MQVAIFTSIWESYMQNLNRKKGVSNFFVKTDCCLVQVEYFYLYSYITRYKISFDHYLTVSICAWFLKCQFGSLLQTQKKINFESNLIFFEFELDFYCLCSQQKSISKANWCFDFLTWYFEIGKKSSDTRYFKNQVEINRGFI